MSKDSVYIISLGGSLIVPQSSQNINTSYLRNFTQLIYNHIAQGKRFFIISGGGYTARHYQQAGHKTKNLSPTQLDWLGIYATQLNAQLIKILFEDIVYPQIIAKESDLNSDVDSYPIAISGGWHPGNSTDLIAVKIAEKYAIKKIINLSNIDFVYTADPKKDSNAKPITNICWPDFKKMVGDTWDPGASAPFDPIASIEASDNNIEVVILNGENLNNLNNYLLDQDFIGTMIN